MLPGYLTFIVLSKVCLSNSEGFQVVSCIYCYKNALCFIHLLGKILAFFVNLTKNYLKKMRMEKKTLKSFLFLFYFQILKMF